MTAKTKPTSKYDFSHHKNAGATLAQFGEDQHRKAAGDAHWDAAMQRINPSVTPIRKDTSK